MAELEMSRATRARLNWLARRHQLEPVQAFIELLDEAISEQDTTEEAVDILVSDGHGIYIPQTLTERTNFEDWDGIDKDNWDDLERGPGDDNEWYWDSMNIIEQNAVYVGSVEKWQGCSLHYNGDLYIVSPNYSYPEF